MTDNQLVDLDGVIKNIGGKEPDGEPAAINRWTFQTKKVRDELLRHTHGRVLNVFAGKTKLSEYKRGIVEIRNDINPERNAEYHVDAERLDEHLESESFDTVVLDPPFDQRQADEHYDSECPDMPAVRKSVRDLVKPGGCLVEFGWHLWGAADYFDCWEREEKVLFRRAIPEKWPIFMTVDRRINQTELPAD